MLPNKFCGFIVDPFCVHFQENVDFKDRETYEGLFKEYWVLIKEKEGLTLEDLHRADIQMKKGDDSKQSHKKRRSQKSHSDSDESVKGEEHKESPDDDHDSDDDDDHDVDPITGDKKKPKKSHRRRKGSKKMEFIGWASKPLLEFIASIGVDTNEKLTQDDVASLVNKYVHENNLLHPDKKKLVLCDVRLKSLIKRKSVSVYKINDVLEPHFFENLNQFEDDGYSSGDEGNSAVLPILKRDWWKKGQPFDYKGSLMERFKQTDSVVKEPNKEEDVVPEVIYSSFATIDVQNMKVVYLKKSLVEKLLEEFETFESKVVGSFVKVKSDPYNPKHPYQLLPVTGNVLRGCLVG